MINCKDLANEIFERAHELSLKFGIKDKKVVIINASNDHASKKYIELKEKKFKDLGVAPEIKELKTKEEIQNTIQAANKDPNVVGIMVQLPLYPELEKDRTEILHLIDPRKDIDGLTNINLSNIGTVHERILPATVEGIIILLERIAKLDTEHQDTSLIEFLENKRVVVINDSKLIGIPLSRKLESLGAHVDTLNKFTEDVKSYTQKADIVVTATGNTEIFDSSYFKNDSILVDVTSLNTENGIKGDIKVDEELSSKVKFITPVPGGVGPLTVSSLMLNTVKLAILQT
jgi:methylenetetrahydrofolate dehydrogenase (NADP+)/methenyltetrahydrofolate cyclohydrolase